MATPNFDLGLELAKPPQDNFLEIGLITAPPILDGQKYALADLTEPNYPGYYRSGVDDWDDAVCNDPKAVTRRSKVIDFRATGPSNCPDAIGFFVKLWTSAGDLLLHLEKFDSPRPMNVEGKNVLVQVNIAAFDFATY